MAFNSRRDLTPELYDIFKHKDASGMWMAIIQKAVEQPEKKYRDVDWLTSVLFYAKHPEREWPIGSGDYLPIDKNAQPASVAEWHSLRNLIRPLVPAMATKETEEAERKPVENWRLDKLPMILLDDPTVPGDHMLQASFQLWLKFNPHLPDHGLYEYRQMIKGGSFTQGGMFAAGTWAGVSPMIPAQADWWRIPSSSLAHIPGGEGLFYSWKEDGVIDKVNRFYGYRDRLGYPSLNGERDEYKPRQRDGSEYFLGDVTGLKGNPALGSRLRVSFAERIKIDIWFRGLVLRFDKPPDDKTRKILETVWTHDWSFHFDAIVTSSAPPLTYQMYEPG